MKIEFLPWDSDFFGLKIARVDVELNDTSNSVIEYICEKENEYDLVYVFGNSNFYFPNDEKYKLVDRKVLFSGTLSLGDCSNVGDVVCFPSKTPSKQLRKLAYTSGKYSRYNCDNRFGEGEFERLYDKWIENSVNGLIANEVLCYYGDDGQEMGMATIKFDDKICKIGLIAVDESCQGKGVGTKLIDATKWEMKQNGLDILEVATQYDNRIAMSFYEKCGLKVKSITNIYHYWCR